MKKAFRQKALTCHPDKHPDDPNAADLFRKYSKAAEILLDVEARKAYEKVFKARKEREIRSSKMLAETRKLKERLEAREKAARDEVNSDLKSFLKLAEEIERLRKQGCSAVREENEKIVREIQKEMCGIRVKPSGSAAGAGESSKETNELNDEEETKVKITWKEKDVDTNAIKLLFERFGQVKEFIVSGKGKSALLVYSRQSSAINAHNSPLTSGFNVKILNLNPEACFKMAADKSAQAASTVDTMEYEKQVLEKLHKRAHLDTESQK